ncbi:MAG: hypothetical protein ACRY3E_01860 [Candidatus Lariskella arthropodorum]
MVDYSNPGFVKARNAASVRKEIESSGRDFATFSATNLTDSQIFTMTNRLEPLSMDDIKQSVCSQISMLPNDCSLSDLSELNLHLKTLSLLPNKILSALEVSSTSSTAHQVIKHKAYKSEAFDNAFELITGKAQEGPLSFDTVFFQVYAKTKKIFTDALNKVGQTLSGNASKKALYADTASKIESNFNQLYAAQVASNESAYGENGILAKLGITPTPANSNPTYVASEIQHLIDAEKNFFSNIALNTELYEKHKLSDLPVKAASILNQISAYQKSMFAMDITCKRYVAAASDQQGTLHQRLREACIEFNSATSQTDIGNKFSDVCVKAFNVNTNTVSTINILGSGTGFPVILSRICSSFTGTPKLDGNGAINMYLNHAFTAGWTSGRYIFNNYLPVELELLDEIAASNYTWLTFD